MLTLITKKIQRRVSSQSSQKTQLLNYSSTLPLPKVTKYKKSTQTKQMDNLSYLKMNQSNKSPILMLIYQEVRGLNRQL